MSDSGRYKQTDLERDGLSAEVERLRAENAELRRRLSRHTPEAPRTYRRSPQVAPERVFDFSFARKAAEGLR